MVLLTWSGCSDYAIDDRVNAYLANRVSLAFNISTNSNATRMSEEITQQPGQSYRGIQDLKLFPFNIQGTIGTSETPLSDMEYEMAQNDVVKTNYFDNHSAKIPFETASFLCYAKAVPLGGKFVNGSIVATGLNSKTPNTSDISFTPDIIHNSVTPDDKLLKIAAYLTDIARAIPADKHDFFLKFVNLGNLVACSSKNVEKLAAWAQENGITLPDNSEDLTGYPSSIYLPEGAAVVMWQKPAGEDAYRFVPQSVTTTEANINRLDRFIYPAELWYYANSRIKTSLMNQIDNYNQSWDVVLEGFENDDAVMDFYVHSVAIKDPLSYAVGCLQVGLVVNNTLTDANEQSISLGDDTFPLTAVFVSGQHEQAFNFTPNDDNIEYIIYDKEISGITMGDAKTSTLSKYTNTLTFQSQDGKNVRFALEFTNNSDSHFMGCNGIVFKDTKFYLVGTIKIPAEQTLDYQKRVFTKGYTTKGTVTISSLKQAYTYLPDLLDPRLEIGIELVPTWIQSTTTNVPL